MNKRASLPGASELFRPTRQAPVPEEKPARRQAEETPSTQPDAEAQPTASGRVKHDHKITVYFSEDELLALEDGNLDLRRSHGIRVDRGRIVRIAVAQALADLAERGPESSLVSELRAQ